MSLDNERVEAWLGASDVQSVTSEALKPLASEFGEFDESHYVLREEEVVKPLADVSVVREVAEALGDVARGAQRKAVSTFYNEFARGRMLDFPDYGPLSQRSQKFFRLESFVQLSSLDDMTLVDQLTKGVVRTRLGAHTGMGKTMKLPGMLAAKCGLRVCQLELDATVAADALKYQTKLYNIPGGLRSWSRVRKAFLCAMSYDEFRGIVLSGNRDKLFADFDLFYMDEAHEPTAVVWAARQYFAAFAKDHNSLLVASATVSTEESNNEAPGRVGKFAVESEHMTFEQALESGKLLSVNSRDRMQVIVGSDEQVAMGRAYFAENGFDVRVLDSASTSADRDEVVRVFSRTTSETPRVLITSLRHGTGYSLPVTYLVSAGVRTVYELDEHNCLVEKELPLMANTVVQHMGRVARGVASGGGGWILTPDRSITRELLVSEALAAYLSLIAAGIKPRPGLFDSVARVLPRGISADTARTLLCVGLPPALSVRYLGTDGKFAAKYCEAISLFTQAGTVLRRSRDEEPFGYDSWIEEKVGNYFVGDDSDTSVRLRVPFASPPGLKIRMHAVSAVAEGMLSLDYWDWYQEEELSDDETIGVRTKVKRRVVPRMPEASVKASVTAETVVPDFWQYDNDPVSVERRRRRQGMSWAANGEARGAVTTLLRAVEDRSLGVSVANPELDVPEHVGKVAYALPLEDEGMVTVRSAGGGKVLLVAKHVHASFMSGDILAPVDAVAVVNFLLEARALERFVKSTVFDNWSPAWLCWFRTYASFDVMERWKAEGLHSNAVRMLGFLYDRFRSEVLSVASSSNLYKGKLSSFFRKKPSISRFTSAVKAGKLPIAQSDRFISRVIEIKDAYDRAVLAIEHSGVFSPTSVTAAQGRLPIRDGSRSLSVIDEKVVSGRRDVETPFDTQWRN